MNSIKYLLRKNNDIRVFFPFSGSGHVESYVNQGDKIVKGDSLYKKEGKDIVETHYVAGEFNVKPVDAKNYLCRLDGEYVQNGEILGEKIAKGGIVTYKIIAQNDGIMSYKRLDEGYIDILSEKHETVYLSQVSGVVKKTDMLSGIEVDAEGLVLSTFSGKSLKTDKNYSDINNALKLKILKDGASVISTKDLESDYYGCAVWAGQYLYPDMIKALESRGCELILANSMSFLDYSETSANICVLSGFGNIHMSPEYVTMLRDIENGLLFRDPDNSSNIFVLNVDTCALPVGEACAEESFKLLEVNDEIICRDLNHFGHRGTIVGFEDEGVYAKVTFADSGTALILGENLEIWGK